MRKVRWGVLGVAKIATEKVIPAMQRSELCEIAAIASRDLARARLAAESLGILRAFGSYEELLADPEIEAIYNPLPNELHVPWTIKALEAGKHVLCEKPIGLDAGEARSLIAARDRSGKLVAEAFMVRCHPQWRRARALVGEGAIGGVSAIQTFFSYRLLDPENVRNRPPAAAGSTTSAATRSSRRDTCSGPSPRESWPPLTATRNSAPTGWPARSSNFRADAI